MNDAPAIVISAVAVAGTLVGLPWMAQRVRRRGLGGGYSLMGPFDEMYHPAALEARVEVQTQVEMPAPAPLPGDRLI